MSALIILAQAALAGAPGPGGEVAEIVVTASPIPVSLDSATTSTHIVDRETLERAPLGGVGEAIGGLAGVRSSFFGPGASRPVIRGLSGPRVLVLSNGLGQIDASALSPDHAVATDPQEASRIEVLRGPSALAYGGSAIGGLVNIVDERIATTRREGLHGRLGAQASSVDDGWNSSGQISLGRGAMVLSLDGLRRRTQDYRVPTWPESRQRLEAEGEAWPGEVRSRVENSFTDLSVLGAGVSYVGEQARLGVSVKRMDTDYGVPGHGHAAHEGGEAHELDAEPGVSIDLAQTRYDLRGALDFQDGPFETVRLAMGHATYRHVELEGDTPGTRFSSEGLEGRLELIQREHDGWRGAVGLQGLSRDLDAQGEEAYVPATKVREWGVFTLQRLDGGALGLEAGLRVDHRDLESLVGRRTFDGVSASLGAFVRPVEGVFLSLSASRSERAPAQDELFADGPHAATRAYERGDPGLQSEVSRSLDLTLHFEREGLEVDAHAYVSDYDGFIDLRPTGQVDPDSGLQVFSYVQADALFRGIEIEGSAQLWRAGERALRLEFAADHVRASSEIGVPARIPPWSAQLGVVYETGALEARVEARHVGAQKRIAPFETTSGDYTLVNASVSWSPARAPGTRIFLDVRNLTDATAREHVSFLKDLAPLPGRNFRLGLAYSF